MKARFLLRGRVNRWLLVAVVVLAAASVAVSACGGTTSSSSDKALLDKMTKVWDSNDVAGAKGLYTADAVIYWPEGATPAKSTGIDEISSLVAGYPVDPMPVEGSLSFTYIPTAKDIEDTSASYDGARFISSPSIVERNLYMVVLEVRDGKVANQWVSYMYRTTP